MNQQVDIAIIGGGPAGLAAAAAAKSTGIHNLVMIERDEELGGILNQCIHNGFGLHTFQEELTGPEYAARYVEQIETLQIPYLLRTIAVDISVNKDNKVIMVMNKEKGLFTIEAKAVILAMGCRERSRGALNIPGYRPAGVYSAGTAQRFVNMEGRMPGREAVILGSGDIGLIMARRMTLEGAKVKMVAELLPYSGGLKRNIVQCLEDYNIPLKFNHTVIDIDGIDRVKGVTVARVDENRKPIPGTEEYVSCDTLLLSCGLIPENELSAGLGVKLNPVTAGPVVDESLTTNVEGVFACGNVLHVHDLVDDVSKEAKSAGIHAAAYVKGEKNAKDNTVEVIGTGGIRYTVPSMIHIENMEKEQVIRFRVDNIYRDVQLTVQINDTIILNQKKRIMAPSEMEQVIIKKAKLTEIINPGRITISISREGE